MIPVSGDRVSTSKLLTEEAEVVLCVIKLVEADIGLDGDARTRISEVGVGT